MPDPESNPLDVRGGIHILTQARFDVVDLLQGASYQRLQAIIRALHETGCRLPDTRDVYQGADSPPPLCPPGLHVPARASTRDDDQERQPSTGPNANILRALRPPS